MKFTNRVAIVTGGNSGIGLATAQALGSDGATVVLADLREDRDASRKVEAAGSPIVWSAVCDVADEQRVKQTVSETIDRFGRLDYVVNNAGVMVFKPLQDLSTEDWMKVLQVDLMGAFYFTREAFRTMKGGGAIVNVSSIHAEETTPLVASYAAAKAALVSLTRSSAIEGQEKGIRVNTVLPGAVDTPMLWENPNIKSGAERVEPRDVGRPQDIANAIAYLLSDEATFVTGAALRVDGGRLGHL